MAGTVKTDDVQSLVFSGHARLPEAMAVWVAVQERPAARAALRDLAERVSFGIASPARQVALQLLLSAAGLAALGIDAAGLGRPFRQGIVAPHRSRALGDAGRNDPDTWTWNDRDAHAVVLVYAPNADRLATEVAAGLEGLEPGFSVRRQLSIRLPADGREHFGFRDGLARVAVDLGDGHSEPGQDLVSAGEALLGHRNSLGVVNAVPALGFDASYVVLRELEQDVEGFWRFWRGQGNGDEGAVWLAAKGVGRWPNGMPASGSAPGPPPPADEARVVRGPSFRDDPYGDQCPVGAHIRRAHPRDGLAGGGPERSLSISAQHRLLRRGRVYGPPAPAAWLPAAIPGDGRPSPEAAAGSARGLLFACLVGDIARQFEFVQQAWLNNPKHAGLTDEVDPIAAGHGIPGDQARFSVPRDPLRRRMGGVARWVTVRGGGYFLLPGRDALRRALA